MKWGNLSAGWRGDTPPYPAWALALLTLTIVGDILGSGLVIASVLKNKRLRKAGEQRSSPRRQGGRKGGMEKGMERGMPRDWVPSASALQMPQPGRDARSAAGCIQLSPNSS